MQSDEGLMAAAHGTKKASRARRRSFLTTVPPKGKPNLLGDGRRKPKDRLGPPGTGALGVKGPSPARTPMVGQGPRLIEHPKLTDIQLLSEKKR